MILTTIKISDLMAMLWEEAAEKWLGVFQAPQATASMYEK